jgi:hypothetical protein
MKLADLFHSFFLAQHPTALNWPDVTSKSGAVAVLLIVTYPTPVKGHFQTCTRSISI